METITAITELDLGESVRRRISAPESDRNRIGEAPELRNGENDRKEIEDKDDKEKDEIEESLLSSASIFKQSHTGIFNLCIVVLVAINSRLIIENLMKGQLDFSPESTYLDTGGLSRDSFPKDFIYGTATSAYQVEGAAHEDGRGDSIWDVFLRQPGLEVNNASGEVTVDQYHRYKEDIFLMAKLNFDAYRFSISWSRIFPNGTGKVNWKGVAYNRLINYMLQKGITPYANLNHYDLPQALQERYNGWLGREVVKIFADYADFCFKMYGDRVKNWFTFNEPRVVAALGYNDGFFAPSRCSKPYGNCTAGNSETEPYIAAHNLILCHASAVQRYREKYQKTPKGRIGILLDFVWYEPLTRGKSDEYAAQRARDFHLGWFLHPIVYGEYPKTMKNIVKDGCQSLQRKR